jgi:hypothetical protein
MNQSKLLNEMAKKAKANPTLVTIFPYTELQTATSVFDSFMPEIKYLKVLHPDADVDGIEKMLNEDYRKAQAQYDAEFEASVGNLPKDLIEKGSYEKGYKDAIEETDKEIKKLKAVIENLLEEY